MISDNIPEKTLKRFQSFTRQMQQIRNSTIGKAGKVKLRKIYGLNLGSGERSFDFKGYDEDALYAIMPIMRQFIRNKSDPIYFYSICNEIERHCSRQEIKDWVRFARSRMKSVLIKIPSVSNETFVTNSVSLDSVIEKLFYGQSGLFHVSDESSGPIEPVERLILHAGVSEIMWCIHIVDSMLYFWLDEPTKTVPPTPVETKPFSLSDRIG